MFVLMSDLELSLTKEAYCKENKICFLYKGVSYTREPTVLKPNWEAFKRHPVTFLRHLAWEWHV